MYDPHPNMTFSQALPPLMLDPHPNMTFSKALPPLMLDPQPNADANGLIGQLAQLV